MNWCNHIACVRFRYVFLSVNDENCTNYKLENCLLDISCSVMIVCIQYHLSFDIVFNYDFNVFIIFVQYCIFYRVRFGLVWLTETLQLKEPETQHCESRLHLLVLQKLA